LVDGVERACCAQPVIGWAGMGMSGIARLAAGIEAELAWRLPRQRETQRGKLALLVATMLSERSARLMDLAAALPRPAERTDLRHRRIARLLANPRVDCDAVMRPFAEEAIRHAAAGGTVVLLLDPSGVSTRHQMLVLSVRVGERALPLAWRVRETRGSIGSAEQRELLTLVAGWLPAAARIVLMGDRFYGGPDLIALCRGLGGDWRLRLKQDLLAFEGGGETTLAESFAGGQHLLSGIELTGKRVVANVATVHEPGHPEPWMIAMSESPTVHRAFDYGLRWGIEAMFSDFETRGFGLEDSRLRHPERLARLLLVMALALHWAVSTGMWEAAHHLLPAEKKSRARGRGQWPAAEPPSSGVACAASNAFCSSSSRSHPSGASGGTDGW
jgi:hypothetical protein